MHVKKTAVIAATSAVALAVPASAAADYGHVVTPGESLESIAAADGISTTALAAVNGLSAASPLSPGQVIEIPPAAQADDSATSTGQSSDSSSSDTSSSAASSGESAASEGTSDADSTGSGGYTVQPGDTLSAIAAREGVSAERLAALNGVSTDSPLQAGTSLTMPGSSGASNTTEETGTSGAATGTANQQVSGGDNGPYPSHEFTSPSQVGSEASVDGVDPSFAAAIAKQESGFNNDEVSPTGAVGVMQIEPNTWNWINRHDYKPNAPLNPASAYGNVAGGVRLLHTLVQRTGSDSGAAAAYYQGLDSIQKNGLYSDTKQYVRSVMSMANQF